MNSVREGEGREALKGIERLDCANPDKTLASCHSAAAAPPVVLAWQKEFARASVDGEAYGKALATELRGLVCASDANPIRILRRIVSEIIWGRLEGIISGRLGGRLAATGREAPALVDFIMSKDCPVSASLTEDDKTRLLMIKQFSEQGSAPPPTPKKEK